MLITIPQEYPLNPLEVVIQKSKKEDGTNIEPELLEIFEDHIHELVRRYHLGYDGLESDLNEGKIGDTTVGQMPTQKMTYEDMQYDIDFLRRQANMKEGIDDYHVRKKYRRIMRKEAQRELERVEAEEKRMKELQENNKLAKPCLFELIDFVIHRLVRYFPNAV